MNQAFCLLCAVSSAGKKKRPAGAVPMFGGGGGGGLFDDSEEEAPPPPSVEAIKAKTTSAGLFGGDEDDWMNSEPNEPIEPTSQPAKKVRRIVCTVYACVTYHRYYRNQWAESHCSVTVAPPPHRGQRSHKVACLVTRILMELLTNQNPLNQLKVTMDYSQMRTCLTTPQKPHPPLKSE